MRNKYFLHSQRFIVLILCFILSSFSQAVTSKIKRHSSGSDFEKGETENLIISSRGSLQLGLGEEKVITEFDDIAEAWSINSIVVSSGTVYFGTSPNGGIYKYNLDTLTKIYPLSSANNSSDTLDNQEEGETVEIEEQLTNEHIFAMTTDIAGRLLAGISGRTCKLCRYDGNEMETVFEPNEAKYIYAITLDNKGDIFLGTGPEGKIYKIDSLGNEGQLVYTCRDKNILSLAFGEDGFLYAGSDERGLIYKINTKNKEATVLYDSDQPEIASLLFLNKSNGDLNTLFAAATSAKIVQTQTQFAESIPDNPPSGRPEILVDSKEEDEEKEEDKPEDKTGVNSSTNSGQKLQIANIKETEPSKPLQGTAPITRGTRPRSASNIYKINQDGFVTDIFGEATIFFCLAQKDNKILIGTGNNAELYSIDPEQEQQSVIYEDKKATQITAVTVYGDDIYLGTANPAKIIKLGSEYAAKGTYISDLIDAEQPSQWGKLQLEADIPPGCKVKLSSRSGNVEDVNDPTFSSWTEPEEITGPMQLRCPLGRFCQYKLIMESNSGSESPVIREIAVASTVPNLSPKVESVAITRLQTVTKQGVIRITYRTNDDNDDDLIYKIDFRKIGRANWIELTKDHLTSTFEWDGKTVEDGRYEVRITASDERSNTPLTKLTGSRVSETIIVDNTGPEIKKISESKANENNGLFRILKLEITDEFSAIDKLEYTIDSNENWNSSIPDDMVYDTTTENFTIAIDSDKYLSQGDHVLTIKASDSNGNIKYKTFEINID